MAGQPSGRPSPKEQTEIAAKLKPFFEMGVSAYFTAQQPNMPALLTIQNYFRKWKEDYLEDEAPDVTERQMQVKGQFLAVYQKMLFNLNAQLNEFIGLKQDHRKHYLAMVEKAKQEKKDLPKYKPDTFLENKFTSLSKLICEIESAKASVMAAPYANERTYNAVLAQLQDKFETTAKKKVKKK